ncbi:hypothetical protein KSP40_PGU013386 [Platanthera guangdongensis]|uniref:Uncharacterized protein n=1 Tax=Platanthera guangdongensis TaxID=2320717 RepID=A0ABR2MWU7_9ASPA
MSSYPVVEAVRTAGRGFLGAAEKVLQQPCDRLVVRWSRFFPLAMAMDELKEEACIAMNTQSSQYLHFSLSLNNLDLHYIYKVMVNLLKCYASSIYTCYTMILMLLCYATPHYLFVDPKKYCNRPFLFESAYHGYGGDNGSDSSKVERIVLSSGKLVILDKLLIRLRETNHQFGSGDRSEHMLLYYFPQWQVTNHRVENTLHAIEDVMECESLDVFIHALLLQHEMGTISSSSLCACLNSVNIML